MSWEMIYDAEANETTFQWTGSDGSAISTTISGRHTDTVNGRPKSRSAKEAIAELIQNAGTPERIRMQWDANYPFEDLTDNS
jgi:hypothetical protein